jgi:hypothetical protein
VDLLSLFIDRGVESFDDLHGVFRGIRRNDVYLLSVDMSYDIARATFVPGATL